MSTPFKCCGAERGGEHKQTCRFAKPKLTCCETGACEKPVAEGEQAESKLTAKPIQNSTSIQKPTNSLAAALKRSVARSNGTTEIAGLKPTEEQHSIIKAAKALNGKGVLIVEAGAGTGKTSSLKMLEEVLSGKGQYTAFNKSLVEESKRKFQKANCNTTHSLAFRAVGNKYAHRLGGARIRSEVVATMLGIKALDIIIATPAGLMSQHLSAGLLASQLMGATRRYCQSADLEIADGHFKYIDGIDLPSTDGRRTYANNKLVRDYLLPFARTAWTDLSDPDGQLPFSADVYVKVWQLDKPIISCDYLLLDEAQDTAPVMLDIVRQNAEAGTLVILVGDSAQSIYEWRGAVNAMTAFPGAPRELLSQSFRFGEAIASLANQVLDCLEEKTPLRLKGLPSILSRIEPLMDPKAILCRTNAMAIGYLLHAIADGKKPFLIGGGSDVIAFVKAAQALQEGRGTSHPDLACFQSWKAVQEYVKLDEGEDLKLMVKIIDQFGPEEILGALEKMPEEKYADVIISTAHKCKGREWESVKLAPDFPPLSKSSDSDLKLLYVALTRAKLVLDVSECAFFTGQDALPFEAMLPQLPEVEGVARPAPSVAPTFTWSKGTDGKWLVRGPSGKSGETVEVVRRDGSTSKRRLADIVWDGGSVATYQV